MRGRRLKRFGCLLTAFVCLVLFVRWSQSGPESLDSRGQTVNQRVAFGLPFSPWCEYVSWYEAIDLPDGGRRSAKKEDWRFFWLSWSWPLLAGGVAGVVAFRRLRPARATDSTTDGE